MGRGSASVSCLLCTRLCAGELWVQSGEEQSRQRRVTRASFTGERRRGKRRDGGGRDSSPVVKEGSSRGTDSTPRQKTLCGMTPTCFLDFVFWRTQLYFGWESSPGDYSPFTSNPRIETALCAKNIIGVRLMCTYMAMAPGFKGPSALFLYV